MRKRIVTLIPVFIVITFLGLRLAWVALAQDDPHGNYSALTDACASCHRAHTGLGARLLYSPLQGNDFCYTCHDGSGAPGTPVVSTHANVDFSGGVEASFSLTCVQCHDPHGSPSNLYNIKEYVLVQDGPSPITTGPVVFTATTGPNSYDDGVSDPVSRICVTCHDNVDNPGYPMTNHTGGAGHMGGGQDYSGQDCIVCHPHSTDDDRNTLDGFMPAGGCDDCHGVAQDNGDGLPPGGRRAVVDEFGYTSHHVQGPIEDSDCTACHAMTTHMSGYVRLADADDSATDYAETAPGGYRILDNPGDLSSLTSFCRSCHDGDGAQRLPTPMSPFSDGQAPPTDSVHSNVGAGGTEDDFQVGCAQCHGAHGGDNLSVVRTNVVVTGTITTGPVIFTARTGLNSFDDGVSDPITRICVTCHDNNANPGYPMTNHPGGDHGPGMDYRGQDCTTCHPHVDGFIHGGGSSTGCIECHGHDAGTLYDPDASFPYTPGATASQGRGTYQSHSTHTESDGDDLKGPGIYCDTCHDINNFPYFNSGTDGNGDGRYDLAETDVCDTCHSPGGTYDGIDDSVIGAKNNWDSGIYLGANLVAGKEQWCAGCHDEAASVIQSVSAPNIVGDEDANTNYGLGYGFYKTGHGLPATQTYPASGGTVSGAGISCGYCHDLTMKHVDGVTRTYTYTATIGNDDDYQHGYRLESIDDQLPLVLPRTGTCADTGVNATEFRLCFSCHESGPFTDPNNYGTNFRHTGTPDFNAHNYHLSIMFECGYGPVFQSDWRSHDNDSRASCTTCHNVHGSEQLAMVRDGKLVNRDPGLQVLYFRPGVSFSCFNYPDPSDVSLPESTGTIWDPNVGGLCSTCHGSCGLDTVYYRNIPPQISQVQGQVGSNILTVDFSEGVYSDLGATGDLIGDDFTLTDLDNGRTITGVIHTAGEASAIVTLDLPLDATDDIGTDTLAAATLTSIYDAADTPMDTTPMAITGPGAQTLALHPADLDSAVSCNPVGGIWADILDSNDGDTTYANCYSYFDAPSSTLYTAQFNVDMDDPSGLEGATIDQLAARAVVNVTEITGGGGPPGPLAYLQICYDTGGPSQECSALYDLDGTEGYVEIWVGNTVDPDGNPLDLDDLNNLRVEVILNADDCCGDATATAHVTEVYAEIDYTIATDFDPPTLSNQTPPNGAADTSVVSNLTFTLADGGSGVDWTTFEIQLLGSKGYSELYTDTDFFIVSKTGSPASYDVIVNPDVDFGGEEVITVTVHVDDYAGNPLVHPTWSFTTAATVIPQMLVLHPSGVASDGGFTVTGGTWADALDTNDGDASFVFFCCSAPGQTFYVDMDDSGLSDVAIQSLTVHVHARYVDGASPSPPPISGDLDIGYRTGTNTIWKGSTTTDDSGNYNLISSDPYSLDSDSGPLDLADIDNLQIAVQRNSSGGANLRVTEVYVEIVYTPQIKIDLPFPGKKRYTIYLPVIVKEVD